jgi:hypothetical protein
VSSPKKRPKISQPHNPFHVTHVKFNPASGEFTNWPEEWQRHFQDSGMPKPKQLEISTPFLPVHINHVGLDQSTSKFSNLPEEWKQVLQDSGIPKSKRRPEISTPRDLLHLNHVVLDPSTGEFSNLPEEWQQRLQNNTRPARKRPQISIPSNPVHITHVGLDRSTGKFTGFPMERLESSPDSEVSKSCQEKNPLDLMEADKVYGDNVQDKTSRVVSAPRCFRSPPSPGTVQSPRLGESEFVDDSPTAPVSAAFCLLSFAMLSDREMPQSPQQNTEFGNTRNLSKTAGGTSRRLEEGR